MRSSIFRFHTLCILAVAMAHISLHAAAPSVVATASPNTGNAPLAVAFDGSSSTGAATYHWEFGDGGSSNAAQVTHIYTVAGTYTATLTVADSQGNTSNPAQLVITVNGTGSGVVTNNMNYRLAPTTSQFKIVRTAKNADSFSMRGIFNTADLPPSLLNLAASIKLNGVTIVTGIINSENALTNPANSVNPSFFVFINVPDQQFNIQITKASLAAALALSGATDTTVSKTVPVTITLTIGAESYDFTQVYDYKAVQGATAIGRYDLTKHLGNIGEGFFVVNKASAIEVPNTKSHFFEFDGYIAESNGVLLNVPTTGLPTPPNSNFVFTLNQADKIVVPIDRFASSGNLITYTQPDRQLGGIHTLVIDRIKRTYAITTWDILSNPNNGGTGLPVRGEAFTTFVFTLRLDLDQFSPAGLKTSTLSVITSTKLSRKTTDDAFWQTGRKNKPG